MTSKQAATREGGAAAKTDRDPAPGMFLLWDRHHAKVGWLVLGFVVGGLVGWWVGGLTSCSASKAGCEVSVGAVEAAGTWFGAVGAVLAVGAGIATFRSGERQRLDEQRSAEERRLDEQRRLLMTREEKATADRAAAERVEASHKILTWLGGSDWVTGISLSVTNGNTRARAFKVAVSLDGYGALPPVPMLEPGRTHSSTIGPDAQLSEEEQPHFLIPEARRAGWADEVINDLSVEYEINGGRWRRIGRGQPERLGDAT